MLITNATVVTWGENPQVLKDHAIFIEDDLIRAIGPTEVMIPNYRNIKQLDARGQLVMPGNICAHTHFYGAYARGLAIPGDAPADFPQILRKLWWTLDKALDQDTVYFSALVSLVDAIKHGTTTLIDHHASPSYISGSLDTIAKAVERAGLRTVLCYEVSDRDGQNVMQAGIDENVRFIEANRTHSHMRGTFGLHASMTLSDETLRACVEALPDESGFHIHVGEHESDQEDSLEKYGKRIIHRLHNAGILGEKTIAAHCVHVDQSEIEILAGTKTWVTHQPRSNMNNAVGVMNLQNMWDHQIPVGLGNDGFSNNMWQEWKTAYLLHKVNGRDPRLADGNQIARMGIQNNAKLAQTFFPEYHFGELTEGAAADMIFVDYKPFTPMTTENLPWHILFGFEASMVTTTIVAGKILMQDRQLVTLNEEAIVTEALALAPGLWERFIKLSS